MNQQKELFQNYRKENSFGPKTLVFEKNTGLGIKELLFFSVPGIFFCSGPAMLTPGAGPVL